MTGNHVHFPAQTPSYLPSLIPAVYMTSTYRSVIAWALRIGVCSSCVPLGCLLPLIARKVHSLLMYLIPFICLPFKAKHRHMTITTHWPTSQTTLACGIWRLLFIIIFRQHILKASISQDRYEQFLPAIRIWRHLKMLKRAGRGHDPAGVKATLASECAVECPACPHPGRNLPAGWENAPESVR